MIDKTLRGHLGEPADNSPPRGNGVFRLSAENRFQNCKGRAAERRFCGAVIRLPFTSHILFYTIPSPISSQKSALGISRLNQDQKMSLLCEKA
jgi:hypothetical protein